MHVSPVRVTEIRPLKEVPKRKLGEMEGSRSIVRLKSRQGVEQSGGKNKDHKIGSQ